MAKAPWSKKAKSPAGAVGAAGAVPEEVCGPCSTVSEATAAEGTGFNFKCTFPMMVMKMSTFLKLKRMTAYEDMIKDNLVFEWTPEMGKVFFLSHQWTSFSHPDPEGEQLDVAQGFLSKVGEGKIRSLFATKEEWLAFHQKETNRFLKFDCVEEEEIAKDVNEGYVWLGERESQPANPRACPRVCHPATQPSSRLPSSRLPSSRLR